MKEDEGSAVVEASGLAKSKAEADELNTMIEPSRENLHFAGFTDFALCCCLTC
jgi:hypothetical protein